MQDKIATAEDAQLLPDAAVGRVGCRDSRKHCAGHQHTVNDKQHVRQAWQQDPLVSHSCFQVVHDVVGFILIVLLHPLKVIPCVGPAVDAWIPAETVPNLNVQPKSALQEPFNPMARHEQHRHAQSA